MYHVTKNRIDGYGNIFECINISDSITDIWARR